MSAQLLLARHGPDDLVCFGAGGPRTASQFAAHARAIAAVLPDAPAGAQVVLACSDRYHFSAGLAAAWLRGFSVALPPNGQAATVHALHALPGVVALLHDRDAAVGIDVRTLDDVSARGELPIALALALEAPAAIAYTSGSTGTPVAHPKALQQLVREPEAHLSGFSLGGRRIVTAVPPYHIYGLLFGVLVPLLGGGSMSRNAPLLPAELLREIDAAQADVLVAVPPHLQALAEHEAPRWPTLHRIFSSAAPLPAATSEALAARGLIVTEVLGSTETGGIAHRSAAGASWQPLPGVQTSVDAEGRLCVDSPWLAPGSARPLCTADRVELIEGGFRHLGRTDAVVKIGGRRIDLGELETRLTQVEGVREARVLAVESGGVRGIELVAVVASDSAEPGALRRALAAHVDPVALPRRFRVVPRLPRTPTGKLVRDDLLALFDTPAFPREQLDDGRVRIVVPPNSTYLRGHFEGLPILPGVVQLQQFALREARRRFPELGRLARVTRVKFKRLIGPREELSLSLQRKGAHVVQFALDVGGQPAASGLLHFESSSP